MYSMKINSMKKKNKKKNRSQWQLMYTLDPELPAAELVWFLALSGHTPSWVCWSHFEVYAVGLADSWYAAHDGRFQFWVLPLAIGGIFPFVLEKRRKGIKWSYDLFLKKTWDDDDYNDE